MAYQTVASSAGQQNGLIMLIMYSPQLTSSRSLANSPSRSFPCCFLLHVPTRLLFAAPDIAQPPKPPSSRWSQRFDTEREQPPHSNTPTKPILKLIIRFFSSLGPRFFFCSLSYVCSPSHMFVSLTRPLLPEVTPKFPPISLTIWRD